MGVVGRARGEEGIAGGSGSDSPVVGFTRNTLGCTCPDEVFSRIEQASDVVVAGVRLRRRIAIGGRLLIMLLDAAAYPLEVVLPGLVTAGRTQRDEQGFNRLRIVIAGPDPEGLADGARRIFDDAPGRDERVHLHLVNSRDVERL